MIASRPTANGGYRRMTWEIDYIAKDNLIDIRTWDNVTIGEMDYSRIKIESLCKGNIVKSVFIDAIDVESMPTKSSLSVFIESLLDSEILTKTKFALLTCKERWNDFQYIEKFGVDRELPMKVFLNRQKALEWLKG
jgi:hypothetical protein